MRLYEFLVKYRTLVIALGLVTSLGLGLLIHLGTKPEVKKPPIPPAAPPPAVQVEINQQPKSAVMSPPNNPSPKLESVSPPHPPPNRNRVSPRPRAVRSVNTQAEPSQNSTGKFVPVIIERRRSVVAITQVPKVKQGSNNETHIQAGDNRLEPHEERAAETDDIMPFFAPPVPPEGGINTLIEGAAQTNIKEALTAYIRTYYPLVTLDTESINLLNPQGKAEYERQKAALDKELFDLLRGSISPTPGEVPSTFPQELIDTLRTDGFIENN